MGITTPFASTLALYKSKFNWAVGNFKMQAATMEPNIQVPTSMDISPTIAVIQRGFKEAGTMYGMRASLERARDNILIPDIRKNFRYEGRPVPWKPLARFTIKRRNMEGYSGGPILSKSFRLERSASARARFMTVIKEQTGDAMMVYGAGKGRFPESVWYANIMHTGGYFGKTIGARIPPRPWAVISPEAGEELVDEFQSFALRKMDKIPNGRAY